MPWMMLLRRKHVFSYGPDSLVGNSQRVYKVYHLLVLVALPKRTISSMANSSYITDTELIYIWKNVKRCQKRNGGVYIFR